MINLTHESLPEETRNLIDRLLDECPENQRCRYLRVDEVSPYCSKGMASEEEVSPIRRMVCDADSLQLWCLDNQREHKCIYYDRL